MDRLKVGVVGVGAMGRNHVRVLSELAEACVVAIADESQTALDEMTGAYGARGFRDYRSLLDIDLDAVVVAVPTVLHHDVAAAFLDRGIGVLVEKPIAADLAQGEDLVARARASGACLMVGLIERFNPAVQALKTAIDGQSPISISIIRVGPFPPRVDDVGIVIDLAVHDIDLIRWLTGSELDELQPMTSRTRGGHEDIAFLQFRTRSGVLAHINTNWLTPYKERRILVAMSDRFISADLLTRTVTVFSDYRADGSFITRQLSVAHGEPLRSELQSFLGAVRDKSLPLVTGEDGLKCLTAALACLRER